ncbi:MAG: C-GCAxxG-C-C family protein [Syntrophales bacterium]|jgi:C_GCAxxG_C_C family probable redox protein|nr:C-GCAxxG-C-C family protein [Syntrophales bacterium]MCK9528814.1 C-GCAxxG-C-C family protein [Syntrophales bacterium]MDX9921986.1 C-GCAxxG-C-C family protein [Syntrophales bacterium]
MKNDTAKRGYEIGFEFVKNYQVCAQCVIGALYEVYPEIRNPDVFRSASGLAGGTGLSTKGQCGALAGAVMVLSQLYGRDLENMDDLEKKRFVSYGLADMMVQKFLEEYGTVICGEIQTKLMGRPFFLLDPAQVEEFEKAGGASEKCPSVVGNATQWTIEILEKRKRQETS